MSKIKVAVIFGGASSEHDISLISAASVIRNLPENKYEVVCIGITKKGRWLYFPGDIEMIENDTWMQHPDCCSAIISPDVTHKGIIKILEDGVSCIVKIDCVFPVLHGKNGEDGTIQGLFALSGIPYVGCDTLSSATCMDKDVTHTLLENAGIKTSPWFSMLYSEMNKLQGLIPQFELALGYPMFIKPANAGSSVGISKAKNKDELVEAIKFAFTHDKKILIEKEIIGSEIECAVLGNENPSASILGQINPSNEFYDFEAKYVSNSSELIIPAPISENKSYEVRDIAIKAFKALGCGGMARVDFFVNDNEIILNEINTIPGFTSISMYPKLWEASGKPYDTLLDELITLAIERVEQFG